MFSKTLFDQDIATACEYCAHIARAADGSLHCAKKGTVQPFSHCRAFEYDPLRRVPRRRPQMPEYDPAEFEL